MTWEQNIDSQISMGGWIPNTTIPTPFPENAFKNEQKAETTEDDHEEL